jgi:hypothetical protein
MEYYEKMYGDRWSRKKSQYSVLISNAGTIL